MPKITKLHTWSLAPKEAIRLQQALRDRVTAEGEVEPLRWVVGVDVAYKRELHAAKAAVVVCRWPDMEVLEEHTAQESIRFPYVPGLLSFREAPVALKALSALSHPVDCLLVDGHGLAHPRRFGLASHLGLWLQKPTIGCAKSKLFGSLEAMPREGKGSSEPIIDEAGLTLGAAVTTRERCKPLYVSVGHKISLPRAVEVVLACCKATKHPEPLRLADRLSKFES